MVPELNNMLGVDMCQYVSPGDVQIVSLSALLATEGSNVSISCVLLSLFNYCGGIYSTLLHTISNHCMLYAAKQNRKQTNVYFD